MKTPVKLYLISPREPCGVTWLINCFLALGIKTYRKTVGRPMWLRAGDYWKLNPEEQVLKKWLPTLSETELFRFRGDFEVEWAHIWPTGETRGSRVMYFIRDPRDAFFSRYKREAPRASFEDFLEFPDAFTLLDKFDSWNLFSESWLAQPDIAVFRFEDYKMNPHETLDHVLDYCGIEAGDDEIADAVRRSSFESAAKAEKLYREQHPEDAQIINRASQIGSWKETSLSEITDRIVDNCGWVMNRLGYEIDNTAGARECSYLPHSGKLGGYANLDVGNEFWNRSEDGREAARVAGTITLIDNIDRDILDAYHVQGYDRWQLLTGLKQFLETERGDRTEQRKRLVALSSNTPDIVWRIYDIMRARGIRIPGSIKTLLRYVLVRLGMSEAGKS